MDKTAKQAIDRYLKWIVESIQDSVVINLMSGFLYGIIILA